MLPTSGPGGHPLTAREHPCGLLSRMCTCLASSRVGASTMTDGARPKGRRPPGAASPVSVWTMGSTKARVLPHPVLARPTRSVPASRISSVCACRSERTETVRLWH